MNLITPPSPPAKSLRFTQARRVRLLSVLAAGACLASASYTHAATEIVYQDDFSNGSRAGWYNSAGSGGLYVNNQTGQLNAINSTARFLTYYDATTLDVGESLTVSFDITMESVANNQYGFRVGILNSGGEEYQVTADDYGSTNELFNNYGGYRLNTNLGADTAGNTYFSERNGTGPKLLADGMTSLTNSAAGVNLTAETPYTVSFTFTRSDSTTLNLSFSMNSIVLSDINTPADTFTFDTLAFYKASSGDIYLNNVEVTYDSIPEPQEMGLTLGVIALLATVVRWRRRS